jgi:hypothetical protein
MLDENNTSFFFLTSDAEGFARHLNVFLTFLSVFYVTVGIIALGLDVSSVIVFVG